MCMKGYAMPYYGIPRRQAYTIIVQVLKLFLYELVAQANTPLMVCATNTYPKQLEHLHL